MVCTADLIFLARAVLCQDPSLSGCVQACSINYKAGKVDLIMHRLNEFQFLLERLTTILRIDVLQSLVVQVLIINRSHNIRCNCKDSESSFFHIL